ncbi:hypothetical protein AB9R89_07640 [Oceanimonas smirnovii]|uniref:Uncharacterized protein n=3 Tax=Oceanimonas smirnovii TaxID=264574 RepID=A0ABW7P1Q1_9GAMM
MPAADDTKQPVSGQAEEQKGQALDIDSVLSVEKDEIDLGESDDNNSSASWSGSGSSPQGDTGGDAFGGQQEDPFDLANKPGGLDH